MAIQRNPALKKTVHKVLLISPQGKITITAEGSRERKLAVPPLGIAYLAASLRCAGYIVEILDCLIEAFDHEQQSGNEILYGLDNQEVFQRIIDSNPDLIGVSCLFSNRGKEALTICSLAKEAIPGVHVVLGGQHPSGMPELILNPYVDYILQGESDYSFVDLVTSINNDEDLSKIDGIVIKTGTSFFTAPKKRFPDVKKMPYPAWDLLDMQKYWRIGMADYEINTREQRKFIIMITSRGCPHSCYFCTSSMMSGKKYREREIPDILAEIRVYRERYGIEEVHFWDDNFFANKNKVKKLLSIMIEEFPDIRFQTPSGSEINALDDEVIGLLAKAGFTKIFLAVESLDSTIQKNLIDKKVNLSRIPDLVKKFHRLGMIVEGSFMVGFPGESKEQIDKTFENAKKYDFDRISISIVNPLPGTPLYNQCKQENLFYGDFDAQNIRWSNENIQIAGIERGYLAKMRRKVWLEYMERRIDVVNYETEKSGVFKE
ncbi:MAG: B12-binding domain-containing radical SAM protein [Smithellaceae bacterium]